jgi:hypothetical protein
MVFILYSYLFFGVFVAFSCQQLCGKTQITLPLASCAICFAVLSFLFFFFCSGLPSFAPLSFRPLIFRFEQFLVFSAKAPPPASFLHFPPLLSTTRSGSTSREK